MSKFSWHDIKALRERVHLATGLIADEVDLLTVSMHERFQQHANLRCAHTSSGTDECDCPVCVWPKYLCRVCMMQVAADAIVDFYEELEREPERGTA